MLVGGIELISFPVAFWICSEHKVENIVMFLLLLSLHRTKAFPATYTTMLGRGLEIPERVGGDTAKMF